MSTPTELMTLLAVAPSSTEEAVLKLLIKLGAQVVGAAGRIAPRLRQGAERSRR